MFKASLKQPVLSVKSDLLSFFMNSRVSVAISELCMGRNIGDQV